MYGFKISRWARGEKKIRIFYVSVLLCYLSEISYEKEIPRRYEGRSLLKDPFVDLLTKIFPLLN